MIGAIQDGIDAVAVCRALVESLPEDAVDVDETHHPLADPSTTFAARSPADLFSNQRRPWPGFRMALGMKLAARERPVALIVGDGSFLYGPILQGPAPLGSTPCRS